MNRYDKDFKTYAWSKLRKKIQSLGENSNWYNYLYSIFKGFKTFLNNCYIVYKQIFVHTSEQDFLDKWAELY